MNRKCKKNGKAIKWIDSRFAWRYRREVAACEFMRRAVVASTVAIGFSQLQAIRAAQFGSKEEKSMKYAGAIISFYKSVVETHELANDTFTARKP